MLETDPRLLSVIEKLNSRPRLECSRIVEEAVTILRSAPSVGPRSREIIRSRAIVSDARTKLVDKKITVIREQAFLTRSHDDVANYLRHKYISYLNGIKNARSREAVVSRALAPLSKRLAEAESAREVLEEVIKDYDSRAFSLRDVIAALQMGEREA